MAINLNDLINIDLLAYFKSKLDLVLSGKVDKETGKGLSSNDYTTDEKSKLANIEAGAQVNVLEGVQVNGSSVSPTNKIANISVPTKTSDITNDSGFITSADVPEGATASTTVPLMNGTASVGTELAFARGDHVHPTDTSRAAASDLTSHVESTNNPHQVTAAQIGAVPTGRTVNAKALSSDITLDASDVGASPTDHSSTSATYGTGTSSKYGHVKLSDATNGTASASGGGTAATPKAVSDALTAAKSYADGISANDFTNDLKSKLEGIEAGAQVNTVTSVNSKTGAVSLTYSDVGAAAAQHGTHVTFSTTTPEMDGTAAVGTATTVSRSDHVHPTDTSRASASDLTSHTGNTTVHITSSERTAWNAKANASDVYTKTEIDQKLAGAMNYKGTKATKSALPSTGNTTGDVWHVTADGSEWAWNGTTWEELGTVIDLSGYVEAKDITLATTTDIDELFE